MIQPTESHAISQSDQHQGWYILDVSYRSVVKLKGKDGLDLLQRLSTNDVAKLEDGKSIQTVLTNEKGKIVDAISILKTSDTDLLLVGNTTGGEILRAWLDKYIIMEDAVVENETDTLAHFLIFASNTEPATEFNTPVDYYQFTERLGTASLYHILCPLPAKDKALSHFLDAGYQSATEARFTAFRVEQGIPAYPNELSLEYNPIEAGLIELISFTKGCYIGQEVIARLDTYKKVQKRLSKFELGAQPEVLPNSIFNSKEEVGVITTVDSVDVGGRAKALGYIKTNVESASPLFFSKNSHSTQIEMIS